MAQTNILENDVTVVNCTPTLSVVETEQSRFFSYDTFKRFLDIVLCTFALFVLAPFMLLCMAIIYFEDGGYPIFAQERVGKNGKLFSCYKFRTMKVNAEDELESLQRLNEADGPVFKIKDDPRITKVGKILRRTSLDELPQIINIIKGDMSIVGPRPALPSEVAQYTDYQKQRLNCAQGLTCIWQIQPHRNDISFDDWVEMDLQYIKEKSLKTDIKLIFKTFGAVIHKQGC